MQMKALEARIAGLEASSRRRGRIFHARRALPSGHDQRVELDEARTAADAPDDALLPRRRAISGRAAAPRRPGPRACRGRFPERPFTVGAIILPGETIATIARRNLYCAYACRSAIRFLKAGIPSRGSAPNRTIRAVSKIKLVYPADRRRQVVADALVDVLGTIS